MDVDVKGIACTICLTQGHRCPAREFDEERGPLCIAHIDGDVCKHTAGIACKAVVSPARVPARKPPAPPIDLPAPKLAPIQPKEKFMAACAGEKVCACGCKQTFIPTGNAAKFMPGHNPKKAVRSPTKTPEINIELRRKPEGGAIRGRNCFAGG
jgi:hypothetical protein